MQRSNATVTCRVALLVTAVLLCLPSVGEAQPQLPQAALWCLRWTDNCTTCERGRSSGEIKCAPIKDARPSCRSGPIRCVMEDAAALRAACESWKTIRENCNACPPRDRPQLCTLKLCRMKEIVCTKPRI